MGTAFSVKGLHFRYPSSSGDVIKGISFDVLEGEIFEAFRPVRCRKIHYAENTGEIARGLQGQHPVFWAGFEGYEPFFL